MTVLIAIKKEDQIFLGTDSCVSIDDLKTYTNKIFEKDLYTIDFYGQKTHKETVYFAFSGSLNIANYIKYTCDLPKKSKDETYHHYVFKTLMNALKQNLITANFCDKDKPHSDVFFIIIINNTIYKVWDNFSVAIPEESYVAFGSGTFVALGSLYTTKHTNKTPQERIKIAINACDYHLHSVDNKIQIIECVNNKKTI